MTAGEDRAVADAVSTLLGVSVRDPVRLSYEGARCPVVRLTLTGGSTVIAKRWTGPRGPLVREREALRAMAQSGAADVVPHILAASEDGSLLVVSDLRFDDHARLGEILEGDDPDHAEAALIAHMKTLGRVHAAGAGAPALALAQRLSAARPFEESHHFVHTLDAQLAALPARLRTAGVGDIDISDEVAAARETLRHPGALLTITHGDATPANACFHGGRGQLFDWETAGPRNALVDGAYAGLRYLQSVWAHEIPAEVRRRAMTAYRDAVPWSASQLRAAEAAAAAAWTGALLATLPRVAQADVRWGRTTLRQRIATAVLRLAEVCDETAYMPRLAVAAHRAHEALRHTWPSTDCTLPPHRAFR